MCHSHPIVSLFKCVRSTEEALHWGEYVFHPSHHFLVFRSNQQTTDENSNRLTKPDYYIIPPSLDIARKWISLAYPCIMQNRAYFPPTIFSTPFLCGPKTHKTTEKPPKQPSSQILAAICMRLILSDSCFDADRVMFYAFSVYVYVYVYNKYIDG